jgi:uracil phosphoribosyltransferase
MIHLLSEQPSVIGQFITELRDTRSQTDSMRFRTNMERIGEVMAYEISKALPSKTIQVDTPLGQATEHVPTDQIVIGCILRAGLPFHQGMLRMFDKAGNAFISAYRKHHKDGTFDINVEYVSCPDLTDKILILVDPMLATGSSMVKTVEALMAFGTPKEIHFAAIIAAREGLDYVRRMHPKAHIWLSALDEELTARAFIVPGLGDAGDLAYGPKVQE